MEQQFRLQMLKDAAKSASREQLEEIFLEVNRQLMLKDNWIRQIFKECYLHDLPSTIA
ncbi:MAG: NblA/ycf18 family protein [Synechococcus sp.]